MISWLLSGPLKEAATISDVDLVFSSVRVAYVVFRSDDDTTITVCLSVFSGHIVVSSWKNFLFMRVEPCLATNDDVWIGFCQSQSEGCPFSPQALEVHYEDAKDGCGCLVWLLSCSGW